VTRTRVLSGARVTYERAGVDEIAAAGSGDTRTDVSGLVAEDGVEEAYVLRTCNRVEAYVVAESAAVGRPALDRFFADVPEDAVVVTDHEESLRHLMRVAAGLESMVLGEDRVLGQVREAYEHARGAGGVGPVLEEAVTKAIHVGERVRTETAINEGVVSMGSAAAQYLDERVGLSTATALVVGAGDIGSSVAKALDARGIDELVIANRTVPNADHLAGAVDADAEAVGLDALHDAIERASVVVTATGAARPVIDRDAVDGTSPTWIVDMGQPRDVAPTVDDVEGVRRFDLDALERITAGTRERRREAAREAEEMIDAEFDHLLDRFKRKRADEVVAAMHESADRVKRRELERAIRKMEAEGGLTDEQREVVEALADSLVGQLLAAPTKSLRDAAAEDDWTTIATALQLFDPEFGADPPDFVTEGEGAPSVDASEDA
jgi:glutamyl-tRNA reductase